MIRAVATERGLAWTVDVELRPDPELAASDVVVVTSDAWILDQAGRWFGLIGHVVQGQDAWVVDLG